jgi:hypothetical protein
MLYDYVFIKELKSGQTKTQKQYPIVISEKGERWNLLNNEHVELGKAYTFGWEFSDNKQFKNIKQVIPLQNIFKIEALKELSSKNDITRNVSIAVTQAIQCFAIEAKMPNHEDLFALSDKIYEYVSGKVDTEYDKINNSGINPKDVK